MGCSGQTAANHIPRLLLSRARARARALTSFPLIPEARTDLCTTKTHTWFYLSMSTFWAAFRSFSARFSVIHLGKRNRGELRTNAQMYNTAFVTYAPTEGESEDAFASSHGRAPAG